MQPLIKKLLILTLSQAHLALAAIGIFNNEHCHKRLQEIGAQEGQKFLQVAVQQGYSESEEIAEYVERHKRAQYLFEQIKNAANEQEMAKKKFIMDMNYVVPKSRWPGEGMFKGLIQAKPPKTSQDRLLVLDILALRMGAAMQRGGYSMYLSTLSPMVKLEEFSAQRLREAATRAERFLFRKGSNILETEILVETYRESLMFDKKNQFDMFKRQERNQMLIDKLLKSEIVPLAVKEEIEITLDFNEKYSYPLHLFSERFLRAVAEYLELNVNI